MNDVPSYPTFDEQINDLNKQVAAATSKMDMSHSLLEEVIERTGNFREGYFSIKMIREHTRGSLKTLMRKQIDSRGSDEVLENLREFVKALENIHATIMREIDRIDS